MIQGRFRLGKSIYLFLGGNQRHFWTSIFCKSLYNLRIKFLKIGQELEIGIKVDFILKIIKLKIFMGQNCTAKTLEKQYLESKMTADTKSEVPKQFKTVRLPRVSAEVCEILETIRDYQPKAVNREKGQYARPKIINDDGAIYEGEWINHLPHGKGMLYFPDGSVFDGIFSQGFPVKEGRLINSNGIYYEGEIQEGMANGDGKVVNFLRKFTYEGKWKNNIPEGFGKQKWGNRCYYEGQFKQGQKHGYGKYHEQDNFTFQGYLKNNKPTGKGKITYRNKDVYQGNFKQGRPHGTGIYRYSDGAVYQGQFNMGHKHGKGKYKNREGVLFQGLWKHGKRHGKGTLTYPKTEQKIYWQWKNDKPAPYE